MIGQTVSHYRILEKLGQGGMGVVYAAEDTHLGRRVAVKFAVAHASSSRYRARFLREARSASALNHPNIAAIYDYGEDAEGQPFLVMELIEGRDLFHVLQRGKLSVLRSLEIAAQVAEALREAHNRGILHRDIKPSNVVINDRGQVKVLDFGLAKPMLLDRAASADGVTVAAPETIEGFVVGTPAYMSPEQIKDATLGPESDLFALGCLLYECLTRRPAFSGANSADILAAVLHIDPPPPSHSNASVPPDVDAIVLKALAKDPEARYRSADEMLADISAAEARITRGDSQETLVLPPMKRRVLKLPRGRTAGIAAAVALAAAGAVSAVYYFSSTDRPAPDAVRWYEEGVNALRDGTYYKASRALERAVRLDSKFHMAHARLAEAWSELQYGDKAKQEMLRADPPGSSPRLTRADRDYLQAIGFTVTGDYQSAILKYRGIVDSAPSAEKANAEVDLGRAYDRAEDVQHALATYLNATRLQPQNPAAWLRLGIDYARKLDQANAEQAFHQAESLYADLSNPEGVNEVQYQRATLAVRLGNLPLARSLLTAAIDTSRGIGSISQEIMSLLRLSYVDCQSNNLEAAEAGATHAIELARENGIEALTVTGLIDLGNAYFLRGETEQARKFFSQSLVYSRSYNMERQRARALLSLGSLETLHGETAGGMKDVREALDWYRPRGYQKETMQALALMARAQRQQGAYAAAGESFKQQLEIARKLGDQHQIALAQQGIGTVLEAQGRWPEALAAFQQEAEADRQSGFQQYSFLNCARVLWQLGRYSEARQYLSQSTAKPAPALAPQAGLIRAGMALSQRQFAAAIGEAGRLTAEKALGNYGISEASRILALAQLGMGSIRAAVSAATDAGGLAARSGDPGAIARANLTLAAVQLAAEQPDEALASAQAAQKWFAGIENAEGQWRAQLLAAEAENAQGAAGKTQAHEAAEKAAALLAVLAQKWDSVNYGTYLKRPDIQYERSRLSKLVSGK
jgi:tetratricopeptide (TPR) repeat protein/predicted Ser/Thr protein kinase